MINTEERKFNCKSFPTITGYYRILKLHALNVEIRTLGNLKQFVNGMVFDEYGCISEEQFKELFMSCFKGNEYNQ